MTDYGFLRPHDVMDVGDVLAAKIDRQESTLADLVLVTEDTLVRDAISLMREKDVSQLLVTVTASCRSPRRKCQAHSVSWDSSRPPLATSQCWICA